MLYPNREDTMHKMIALTATLCCIGLPAFAAGLCGDAPADVPQQVAERIGPDLRLGAKTVSEVDGRKSSIDSEKTKLYQKHEDVSKYMVDSYFAWVSCQQIMGDDTSMSPAKLSQWREWYSTIFPNGNYPEISPREKAFLAPNVLVADSPERMGKNDAEASQCYTPDPDHRFVKKTATLDIIQNSQNSNLPAANRFSITKDEPEQVCASISTYKEHVTHANISVRLRALQKNIYR
jgi:hypothetical protein